MRPALAIAIVLVPAVAGADPAPVTQTCLGDLQKLACPPGARQSGTECRAASGHWSGSSRQGPAIFLRDNGNVSFAANYKDHKKQGRVYHFDKEGRLESWSDMANDDYHGLSVDCSPEGRVTNLAYFERGKVIGVSRMWRSSDGTLSSVFDHTRDGKLNRIDPTPELARRPDALCRPVRCELDAKPDLSGIPK